MRLRSDVLPTIHAFNVIRNVAAYNFSSFLPTNFAHTLPTNHRPAACRSQSSPLFPNSPHRNHLAALYAQLLPAQYQREETRWRLTCHVFPGGVREWMQTIGSGLGAQIFTVLPMVSAPLQIDLPRYCHCPRRERQPQKNTMTGATTHFC